ncbi:MAG: hypothetical protein PHE24_00820 [Patescibacteria group bacterium]|nr:hypothetical protein [Patescibacteria group bacterium]
MGIFSALFGMPTKVNKEGGLGCQAELDEYWRAIAPDSSQDQNPPSYQHIEKAICAHCHHPSSFCVGGNCNRCGQPWRAA